MVVAGFVASRAGVVEVRGAREAVLVAVFKEVRLVLGTTLLVGSAEVAGLVVRVVRVVFSLSGLAGDVSVRGLAGDLAAEGLEVAGLVGCLEEVLEAAVASFLDESSAAGAAGPLEAGCASCFACKGFSSDAGAVSALPVAFSLRLLLCAMAVGAGAADCSVVSGPLLGEVTSGLF